MCSCFIRVSGKCMDIAVMSSNKMDFGSCACLVWPIHINIFKTQILPPVGSYISKQAKQYVCTTANSSSICFHWIVSEACQMSMSAELDLFC